MVEERKWKVGDTVYGVGLSYVGEGKNAPRLGTATITKKCGPKVAVIDHAQGDGHCFGYRSLVFHGDLCLTPAAAWEKYIETAQQKVKLQQEQLTIALDMLEHAERELAALKKATP